MFARSTVSTRLVRAPYVARQHRVRVAVALSLAAALTVSVSACSDDGGISVPSFSLPSGDQLKKFVADAQGQIDTIGADLSGLASLVKDLPESVQAQATDAIERVKSATAAAESALDDAKNVKTGAEQALGGAGKDLEGAKSGIADALAGLEGKTDKASSETRGKLEELLKHVEGLQEKVAKN